MGNSDLVIVINGECYFIKGEDYKKREDALMKTIKKHIDHYEYLSDRAMKEKINNIPDEEREFSDDAVSLFDKMSTIENVKVYEVKSLD